MIVFWMLASRMTREPQIKGIAGWLLPLLLVPVLNRYPPNLFAPMAFLIAQTLPRAATAVLAWIGRPAAKPELPNVTTAGAICAIILGVVPVVFAGPFGAVLLLLAGIVTRIVLSFSYRFNKGITASSLGWTRQLLELSVLIIWPPESIL
jgi:hypothetical protein